MLIINTWSSTCLYVRLFCMSHEQNDFIVICRTMTKTETKQNALK